MIETSPHVSESPAEHQEPVRQKASFGLRAACFVLAAATLVLISMVYQSNASLADTSTKLAQAQSEADQAKNDLLQANTKSTDLQHQLTTITAQSKDLQAQLKTSQTQTADIQSQLDKAKSQDADLQAQLTATRSHLTEAQARLTQDEQSSVQLRKDLDASKAQAADLQSQLDKAQSPQAAASQASVMAALPVTTAFEKGFFSSTYTLHIKNTNSGPLNVTITINGSQNTPPITTTIKAGDTYDVSKLAAGSALIVTSDGFSPLNLTAH